jgi:ABC-2 type transport system ATP-binding protein
VTSAIEARGLAKRYGRTSVVRSLDLHVGSGEIYGLVGPNGAGKTTVIRMLLGLVHPTEGSVEILGRPPAGPALARVGAIVEEPAFWGHLSGRRNLEYLARAGGRGSERTLRLARVEASLALAGLSNAKETKVRRYSQGMRQRLGIALALLGEPDALILDEPTNGLDPQGMAHVRDVLRLERDRGCAVLVSSHLLWEVNVICDRIGVMSRGRLVAEGTSEALAPERGGRIRIHVDDRARAAAVIGSLSGVEALGDAAVGPGSLALRVDGTSVAEVNAALVRAGIGVTAIGPEGDPLEEAYLALIKDDDVRG